jgi:hypothetical protein
MVLENNPGAEKGGAGLLGLWFARHCKGERVEQAFRPLVCSTLQRREGGAGLQASGLPDIAKGERVEQAFRPAVCPTLQRARVEQAFRPLVCPTLQRARGWSRPSGLR